MDTQIPRLALPTCPDTGWVEFGDLDDMTGADLHALRAKIKGSDSGGETTNAVNREAMRLFIVTWNVPYLADPRTPQANEAAWKKLKARDLRAIEDALEPVWTYLRPPRLASVDDTEPGSPTPPGSD